MRVSDHGAGVESRRTNPGVVHHVFTRGVARSLIAVDSIDFDRSLYLLERAVAKFDLGCHAWCYLPNHFHLVLTSRRGNLSAAMQWLGTCAAQSFNARHARSGHFYQGRFGSRLVESDRHALELARYLPLNPVRAGLCHSPDEWPWSSYAATAGQRAAPWFLDADEFLTPLGSVAAYIQWVGEGVDASVLDDCRRSASQAAAREPPDGWLERLHRTREHARPQHRVNRPAPGPEPKADKAPAGRSEQLKHPRRCARNDAHLGPGPKWALRRRAEPVRAGRRALRSRKRTMFGTRGLGRSGTCSPVSVNTASQPSSRARSYARPATLSGRLGRGVPEPYRPSRGSRLRLRRRARPRQRAPRLRARASSTRRDSRAPPR